MNNEQLMLNFELHISIFNKKWVSPLYRTAQPSYPCFLPNLGELVGSWSYKTYPLQKYKFISLF